MGADRARAADTTRRLAALAGALLAVGCAEQPSPAEGARYESEIYRDEAMWLCRPDRGPDACDSELGAVEWRADDTFAPVGFAPDDSAPVDCFYVYPTVDLSFVPDQHTDFGDTSPMLDPLLSQAARLGSACRVFAPLYRQVTIGTFSAEPEIAEPLLQVAYADVADAFEHFLAQWSRGRPFVLVGHSQGAQMLRRLVAERVETDDALLARLRLALLVGGDVVVPTGARVGGSFSKVPLCRERHERGCVVAYRSYAEGYPPEPGARFATVGAGLEAACTNPVDPSAARARAAGSYFPTSAVQPLFFPEIDLPPEITGPFAMLAGYYSLGCSSSPEGARYLEVRADPAAGDQRTQLIPFDSALFSPGFLGLHVLDFNFPMDDLRAWVHAVGE
ncbi:MAG: DUF3089 domain-containing protein [Polyangiaceae bacterium]|nr:DUF3089 domain-containing protein [Polyangiaceae bacterium]